MKRWIAVALLSLGVLCPAEAFWQSRDSNYNVSIAGAAAYQGPGDIKSGAWGFWSCSRAYNVAYANGTNPLCDLVDATTGLVAICTLRVLTTGFVDLVGNYCTGSTTPTLACAAAAGGACHISKMYDQTGNARDLINGTVAQYPSATFSSSPTGALPVVTGGSGVTLLATNSTFTISQPITLSVVAIRTAGFTAQGMIFGSASSSDALDGSTSTNNWAIKGSTSVNAAATDSAWHSFSGLLSGSGNNCATNVDGSDTASLNCGTTGTSAEKMRILREGSGVQFQGNIAEALMYTATTTSTERNNISTNQHSAANGYNF